ncbi:unnamed protein product, partial [Laminaria digitata]
MHLRDSYDNAMVHESVADFSFGLCIYRANAFCARDDYPWRLGLNHVPFLTYDGTSPADLRGDRSAIPAHLLPTDMLRGKVEFTHHSSSASYRRDQYVKTRQNKRTPYIS